MHHYIKSKTTKTTTRFSHACRNITSMPKGFSFRDYVFKTFTYNKASTRTRH